MKRRSGFGWLELVTGLLLIALGILIFVKPGFALSGLVFLYGLAAVVMGIADIVLYIHVERFLGFGPTLSLISGILSVMTGVMLAAYPEAGVLVLTILFPIWFMAHCISRLAHLGHIRFVAGNGIYYFTMAVNIIGLLLGLLMLLNPLSTLTAIRLFAGFYLILLGIDSVVTAFSPMGRGW